MICDSVMPDSVLMKVDKMSMAHALEIRVPFPGSSFCGIYRLVARRLETKRLSDQGHFSKSP